MILDTHILIALLAAVLGLAIGLWLGRAIWGVPRSVVEAIDAIPFLRDVDTSSWNASIYPVAWNDDGRLVYYDTSQPVEDGEEW